MSKDEYIIINKTAIQKRIEELESKIDPNDKKSNPIWWQHTGQLIEKEINTLKQILSQSTPLIPEIEKAFDAGSYNHNSQYTEEYDNLKQEYISNLKLDI